MYMALSHTNRSAKLFSVLTLYLVYVFHRVILLSSIYLILIHVPASVDNALNEPSSGLKTLTFFRNILCFDTSLSEILIGIVAAFTTNSIHPFNF